METITLMRYVVIQLRCDYSQLWLNRMWVYITMMIWMLIHTHTQTLSTKTMEVKMLMVLIISVCLLIRRHVLTISYSFDSIQSFVLYRTAAFL